MESHHRYPWRASGDVNAYFGLLLDNLAGLLLTVGLLVEVFGMPADFVVGSMVPGTAIGVMVGDLLYTWLAFRLAKKTGRSDVTAMPLGLDTPSIFGITIFVIGPAFLAAQSSGASPMDAAGGLGNWNRFDDLLRHLQTCVFHSRAEYPPDHSEGWAVWLPDLHRIGHYQLRSIDRHSS